MGYGSWGAHYSTGGWCGLWSWEGHRYAIRLDRKKRVGVHAGACGRARAGLRWREIEVEKCELIALFNQVELRIGLGLFD